MKKCQFGMALAYAIAPTTLITVLPVGWSFYTCLLYTSDAADE